MCKNVTKKKNYIYDTIVMGRFIHLEFGRFVDMKFFSSIKPSGSMGIIVVRQLQCAM